MLFDGTALAGTVSLQRTRSCRPAQAGDLERAPVGCWGPARRPRRGFMSPMVALKQIDAESENVSASLGVLARDGADRAAGHHRHQHVLLPQRHGHALVAPGTELAALAVLLMDDAGDAAQ